MSAWPNQTPGKTTADMLAEGKQAAGDKHKELLKADRQPAVRQSLTANQVQPAVSGSQGHRNLRGLVGRMVIQHPNIIIG